MIMLADQVTDWILRHRGNAFPEWPEDVIRAFISKIKNGETKNIAFIECYVKEKLSGILIAKIFRHENRCHISQIVTDNNETFKQLLARIFCNYPYATFSYERRGKAIICKDLKKFEQLITR